MSLLDAVHGGWVHDRRTDRLSKLLAELIPQGSEVLDVGCGDGLLSRRIARRRPDATVRGIDVMIRKDSHVPVDVFDGETIPGGDSSCDVVLFADVLHHTPDPMVLLREATRVARNAVVIKDHTLDGLLAGPTLRFMDRVGNARHGVALPHNYWPRRRWLDGFAALGLAVDVWQSKLGLYPWPASLIFERSLHFVARLVPDRERPPASRSVAP